MAIIATKKTGASVTKGWKPVTIKSATREKNGNYKWLKVTFNEFENPTLSIFPQVGKDGKEWKLVKFFHLCNAVHEVKGDTIFIDDSPSKLVGCKLMVLIHEDLKDLSSNYKVVSQNVAPCVTTGNELIQYSEEEQANYMERSDEQLLKQRIAKGIVTNEPTTNSNFLDANGVQDILAKNGVASSIIPNEATNQVPETSQESEGW